MANVVNEAREFLAAHWQPDMDLAKWKELVIDNRWAALRWPEDCMGRALDDDTAKDVEALFVTAGAPGTGQDKSNLWAGSIVGFGTPELKNNSFVRY